MKAAQSTVNTTFSTPDAVLSDRSSFLTATHERDLQRGTGLHCCLHYLANHVTEIDESLKDAHFGQYQPNGKTPHTQPSSAAPTDYVREPSVLAIGKAF